MSHLHDNVRFVPPFHYLHPHLQLHYVWLFSPQFWDALYIHATDSWFLLTSDIVRNRVWFVRTTGRTALSVCQEGCCDIQWSYTSCVLWLGTSTLAQPLPNLKAFYYLQILRSVEVSVLICPLLLYFSVFCFQRTERDVRVFYDEMGCSYLLNF